MSGFDGTIGAIQSQARSIVHPLSWSIPLLSVCGTSVRIHAAFVLWALVELAASLTNRGVGVLMALAAVYSTLAVLVVRELVRAVVLSSTDRSGQPTDRIVVLWPGVAVVHAMTSRRELAARHACIRTSVVGLASSGVVVGLATANMLWAGGSSEMLAFSPLQPSWAIEQAGITHSGLMWAWWIYAASVLVFLIDLIPMCPMDTGRLLREVIGRYWDERTLRSAIAVLLAACVAVAILLDSTRLLAVVAFAGIWTAFQHRLGSAESRPLANAHTPTHRAESGAASGLGIATGQVIERLRSKGIEHLSLPELAELDQLSAELRDRLHPDSEVFPPADDGTGAQTPIP